MLEAIPKEIYLADLQARHERNRESVETMFRPLSDAVRSWQPAANEWSIDQCFQHLISSFEFFEPNTAGALATAEPAGFDGIFRPSWFISKTMPVTFNPRLRIPTLPSFNPPKASYPDVFTRYTAQLERLSTMLDRATRADLQKKCWYFKRFLTRFNLGEFLFFFVSHDELHIDQAQRVLAAYRQQATV